MASKLDVVNLQMPHPAAELAACVWQLVSAATKRLHHIGWRTAHQCAVYRQVFVPDIEETFPAPASWPR